MVLLFLWQAYEIGCLPLIISRRGVWYFQMAARYTLKRSSRWTTSLFIVIFLQKFGISAKGEGFHRFSHRAFQSYSLGGAWGDYQGKRDWFGLWCSQLSFGPFGWKGTKGLLRIKRSRRICCIERQKTVFVFGLLSVKFFEIILLFLFVACWPVALGDALTPLINIFYFIKKKSIFLSCNSWFMRIWVL